MKIARPSKPGPWPLKRKPLLFLLSLVLSWLSLVSFAHGEKNTLLAVHVTSLPDNKLRVDFQFRHAIKKPPLRLLKTNPRYLKIDFLKSQSLLPEEKPCRKIDMKALKSYCISELDDRVRVIIMLNAPVSRVAYAFGNVYTLLLGGKSLELSKHKHHFFANKAIIRYPLKQKMQEALLGPKQGNSRQEKQDALLTHYSKIAGLGQKKKNSFLARKKGISLNFPNIPLRTALQLLADITKINLVMSDKVSGNISLRLKNVPWDRALRMILRSHALSMRVEGNVVFIAPITELMEQEDKSLGLKQKATQFAPLKRSLVHLHYAKASDLANILRDKERALLSSRGTLSIDARTNTLMIQDTQRQLALAKEWLKQVDTPVKQVLIEARIVDMNKNFARDLGLSFGALKPEEGIRLRQGALSRDLEGEQQPGAPGRAGPLSLAERLNVDLAGPLQAPPAYFGLALATLGNDVLLDLELSAMESEGRGEIIASPRLITMNQQAALIQSGEEVPYQEATSSGATSVSFKKAVLSLQVTPQVTADGKILMDLQINQDRLSTQKYNGVPAIMTKEIKTSVFVENGQTVVLGGIYKQEKGFSVERVPFFGELPLVGALFRKKNRVSSNEELLIFITPRIITDDQSQSVMQRDGNFVINHRQFNKFGTPWKR